MESPKFKIGQTVYFVNDHRIKKMEIVRISTEDGIWVYEPKDVKFPSSDTATEVFATKAEAEKRRLELVEEAVKDYRKALIARGKER